MLSLNQVGKFFPKAEPTLWQTITRRIPEGERVNAIANVSLTIDEPACVGLIGSNGAGKSTLMKIIAGILVPDTGTINALGLIPWKNRLEYCQQLAYMAGQRSNIFPELSPKDSYEYLASVYRLQTETALAWCNELASALNFASFLDRPVKNLSLGNRVKANLIASLIHRPKLMILDEPTIGLDWETKEEVRKLLSNYQKNEKALILISSHDFADIETIASRVLLVEEGQVSEFHDMVQIQEVGILNLLKNKGTK